MTRVIRKSCAWCGKEFKTFQTKGKEQIYDSNSCKQKAYRARKLEMKKAEARTLTTDAWIVQQWIVDTFGEQADYTLGAFFNVHGKEAYQDMLAVIDKIVNVKAQV